MAIPGLFIDLLAQGEDLVPIPESRRRAYLLENLEALALRVDPATCQRLSETLPRAVGEGYTAEGG